MLKSEKGRINVEKEKRGGIRLKKEFELGI